VLTDLLLLDQKHHVREVGRRARLSCCPAENAARIKDHIAIAQRGRFIDVMRHKESCDLSLIEDLGEFVGKE